MRFTLLFLWLTLLPALSLGADASLCQPGYFAQLTQRYLPGLAGKLRANSPIANALKRAAENKFAVRVDKGRAFREDWLEWMELGESERGLLESLPRLKPEERAELIPLVRGIHPEDTQAKRFRKLVLLGLYDQVAWGGLTTSIIEGNLHSHLSLSYLPAMASGMPAELRKEFLESLGDRYHMLTKEKQFRYSDYAPKRMADSYFKHLLKGDEIVKTEIRNGRTPREAFRAYVETVQRYIPGDDHYSADQALALMEQARQALKKKMLEGPIGNRGEEPVLWVGGSLPNGRATFIESDMDIGTNIELPDHVKAAIEKNVKDYVAKDRPDSGIHTVFKKGLGAAFWTKVHPVTFRVRANGIDMVLVNAAGEVDIQPIR